MAAPGKEIFWLHFCIAVGGGDMSSIFIYSQWMGHGPNYKSKCMSNTFFSKIVSVILGSSYHTDICLSAHFSYKFFFN